MEGKNTHKDRLPMRVANSLVKTYGRSVIPIMADKRPPIKWKQYQTERASLEQIDLWQREFSPAMWAQVTGSISGIISLDFDGEEGRRTLERLGLNPHRWSGSGGPHVDFSHPGWHVKTENNKSSEKKAWAQAYPGLDIRGDGGYIIVAGSNSKGPYEWLRDPGDLEDLSILPEGLREMLGLLYPPEEEKPKAKPIYQTQNLFPSEDVAERALEKYLGEATFRGRDNACFDLACQLRDNNYSRIEAETYCIRFARSTHSTDQKGNHQPFSESDAIEKVASAYSYCPREPWTKPLQENKEAQQKQEKENAEEEYKQYESTGVAMIFHSRKDGPVSLSNFSAEILADTITDDGAEQVRSYEVQASIAGRKIVNFSIPAKDFPKCEWVEEHLGARAMVTTGQSIKSHLVNAIKTCSDPREDKNFAHTGWRKIDGIMSFLHAGGQISQPSQLQTPSKSDLTKFSFLDKSAPEASLESTRKSNSQLSQNSQLNIPGSVKLVGSLSNYTLPEHIASTLQAVRASLSFVDIASDRITLPLYGSLWRSVLGSIDFCIHVAGESGLGKSEICALIQQHFGPSMNAKNMPGSWGSTDNSLEMLLFQAKDVIVTVDDFKPIGTKNDQDRLHAKADRIFRQIGNGSTRGRLDSNLQQRAERRSRCLLVSTGEDVPRGQSLKSRGVLITMDEKITAGAPSKRLSLAQHNASSGVYAQAMSSYLEWLAPRIEVIQDQLATLIASERDQLAVAGHARINTNAASIIVGMKYFLQFAYESGALTKSEAQIYLTRLGDALAFTASEADQENKQEKPSEQWRRLLVAALTSKKAYLDNADGDFQAPSGSERIGWIEGDDIFLFPVVAYKAAKTMGSATGDELTTLEPTLRKFLNNDKLLATTDLGTKRKTITVRKSFEKVQQIVLHIKVATLYDAPYPVGVDLPDLVDYSESEVAPEAVSEPSQLLDYEDQELTKLVDYSKKDLTKSKRNGNGNGHHVADEEWRIPVQGEGGWTQGDRLS